MPVTGLSASEADSKRNSQWLSPPLHWTSAINSAKRWLHECIKLIVRSIFICCTLGRPAGNQATVREQSERPASAVQISEIWLQRLQRHSEATQSEKSAIAAISQRLLGSRQRRLIYNCTDSFHTLCKNLLPYKAFWPPVPQLWRMWDMSWKRKGSIQLGKSGKKTKR